MRDRCEKTIGEGDKGERVKGQSGLRWISLRTHGGRAEPV